MTKYTMYGGFDKLKTSRTSSNDRKTNPVILVLTKGGGHKSKE